MTPSENFRYTIEPSAPHKERERASGIGLVFPGQGSQSVGMGKEICEAFPAAQKIFEEANEVLGYDLSKLCFEGSEDDLKQTIHTQPALLTTSIATLAAMAEANKGLLPTPAYLAGHSVGEYAALVASGALPFPDALRLVRERGRLMHEAGQVKEGAMAAILGLDMAGVEQLCQQTGAEIANINCEGQIVISGEKKALVSAIDLARALGAKRAIPLVVSAAFHSSLMKPAVPGMRLAVAQAEIKDPQFEVVSNITGRPLSNRVDVRRELVNQISKPVQWIRSVEHMHDNGVETFIEVGPGKVLTGLIKRIREGVEVLNVGDVDSLKKVLESKNFKLA